MLGLLTSTGGRIGTHAFSHRRRKFVVSKSKHLPIKTLRYSISATKKVHDSGKNVHMASRVIDWCPANFYAR